MAAAGRTPTEQELRAKILAGPPTRGDYTALAHLLLDSPGREEEGVAVLEQALDLPLQDIEKADLLSEMAWLLYEYSRPEQAVAHAERALALVAGREPTAKVLLVQGVSYTTLANCQYATDREASKRSSQLAIDALERLISAYPNSDESAEGCRYAAGVYVLREEYDKAVRLYERTISLNASPADRLSALVCLGNALRCQGRYREADQRLTEARAALEADTRMLPRLLFELGTVQRLTGRPEEAAQSFECSLNALGASPFLRADRGFVAQIRWELANLQYDARQYAEAIAIFRAALPDLLETYPELYWHAVVSLGHCFLATHQYARARDCYEEVVVSAQAPSDEKAVARDGLAALPSLPPPTVH